MERREWDDHKYYKKVPIDQKHSRYFYSKEEYDAYMRGKSSSDEKSNKSNLNIVDTGKNLLSSIFKKASDAVEDITSKGNDTISNVKKEVKNISSESPINSKDILNNTKSSITKAMTNIGDIKLSAIEASNEMKKTISKVSTIVGGLVGKEIAEKIYDTIQDYKDKKAPKEDNKNDSITPVPQPLWQPAETDNPNRYTPTNIDKKIADYEDADNEFTDKEVTDNLKRSGYMDKIKETFGFETDSDVEDWLKKTGYNIDEEYDDFVMQQGLFNELDDDGHPKSFDDLQQLESDVDDDIDMEEINQENLMGSTGEDVNGDGYPDNIDNYGYSNNCAYCTLAYEYRQRGYDVEASSVSVDTMNNEAAVESWFKDGEIERINDNVFHSYEEEILNKSGNNTRGMFLVYWNTGGGHAMVYEVIDNEVYIRDCQINKKYKLSEYPNTNYISEANILRTDNLELTEESLVGIKNKTRK